MHKSAYFLIILVFLNLFLPFLPQKVYAAQFDDVTIRLTRQAVSRPSGGLVCATTPSSDNGVEASFQIIFPTGFNVNQTASNWTVDTSDLPAGAVAWPGISIASAVNSQTVTFPSSNLSPSTQYCFNFDSTNTLATPTTSGSYEGTVRTRNNSNTTIDSLNYAFGIVSNDSINVTATVPANPDDLQAELELLHPENTTLKENSELIYKLYYGSNLNSPSAITVQADWSLGTIDGNSVATEDILDYKIGTATLGYNDTPPIVDVVNRRITWTFNSFPAHTTDQVVNFRLLTNESYRGPHHVDFSVSARVLGPGTQTPDSKVNSSYKYGFRPPPGPTNTPAPTIPSTTSTPTPVSQGPVINDVNIRSITENSAQIEILTNPQTTIRLRYGESQNALNQVVNSELSRSHLINLTNLEANKRYFFRITAIDSNNRPTTSDFFLVDTATGVGEAKVILNSLILTSGDVLLADPLDEESKIILPKDTRFSFKFAVENPDSIESITGFIRNRNVLGVSTNRQFDNTNSLSITEIIPGRYIGSLTTNQDGGNYTLVLSVSEFNGNISEFDITDLEVVDPFKIVNGKTNEPIEAAKVNFYLYNVRLRKYEPISSATTPLVNPAKTDRNGLIQTVLPEGKYKVEVFAFGFKNKVIEFEIGKNSTNYPLIKLDPAPFSITAYFEYILSNLNDALNLFISYFDEFKSTSRFLELLTLFVIILFVILSLIQISSVFGVPIIFLPFFALYHLKSFLNKPKHESLIQGKVVDIVTNVPIEGVLLHFANSKGKVFAHSRSNHNGEFAVPASKNSTVRISVSKKGFSTISKTLNQDDVSEKLVIALSHDQKPEKFSFSTLGWYFKSIFDSFFETFLVLTIILEIFFAQQFGIVKVLPCLVISIANFLIWALHARPHKPAAKRA